jgi:hypothetical protein
MKNCPAERTRRAAAHMKETENTSRASMSSWGLPAAEHESQHGRVTKETALMTEASAEITCSPIQPQSQLSSPWNSRHMKPPVKEEIACEKLRY